MSTLQTANIHFESTGNNRLQYTGSNAYNLVAGGLTTATINSTSFYVNSNFDVAGTFKVNGADVSPLGKQTIWMPAAAMTPRINNGPSSGWIEMTGSTINLKTLDFDSAVEEAAQFEIQMPKSWDRGNLVSQFIWSHPATTTNFGVSWGIEAAALGDSADLASSAVWTAGVDGRVSDTGGLTNYLYITPETNIYTPSNTPASEEWVVFQIYRAVANTNDTMAVDARLHGVKIHYIVNAAKDD